MSRRDIQFAKERNLVDIVMEQGPRFRRAVDHIKINCVFHNERTPSLAIYEDHYYCYSCGEHGDVIDWVMKTNEVPFGEAVKLLNGNNQRREELS